MRFFILAFSFLLVGSFQLQGQNMSVTFDAKKTPKYERYKMTTPLDFACDHSEVQLRDIKLAPKLVDMASRNEEVNEVEFIVSFIGTVPEDVKAAFNRAGEIWAAAINSPITINLVVNWAALDDGVLGSASPTEFYRLFNNAPGFNRIYPIALAEKLINEDINTAFSADIELNFNSNFPRWYTGLDQSPAANEYDLVEVALHEICHGLGFFALGDANNDTDEGFLLFSQPGAFMDFMYEGNDITTAKQITDTTHFQIPSNDLYRAFTGSNLFFYSKMAVEGNNGAWPELYAPGEFSVASSISHVDQATFEDTPRGIMTPQASPGSAIHLLDSLTLGILNSIGWSYARIDHEALGDTEDVTATIDVIAGIVSDELLYTDSLYVHVSLDSFKTQNDTILMVATETADQYSATFPAYGSGTEVQYYISAHDDSDRTYTWPNVAPTFYNSIFIGPDTEEPEILHDQPVIAILVKDNEIRFDAEITDNIGVDSVYFEWRFNSDGATNIEAIVLDPFVQRNDREYFLELELAQAQLTAGDTLQYRIVAIDSSSNMNIGFSDEMYHNIFIEAVPTAIESYSNNFDVENDDFIGNNFSIVTPSGFSNPAIHSDHPYLNGSGPNDESNYTFQLRTPVIVRSAEATIQFDEIPLVEPGADDVPFGEDNFWDYVIVEGSKDLGETWTPFLDGYDARAYSSIASKYNGSVDSNSFSTYEGTSGDYQSRSINMLDKFQAQDTVLIRFRMFADQAANGWGWSIDNLEIQTSVPSALDEVLVEDQRLKLFPNPSNGSFKLTAQFKSPVKELSINVFDVMGKLVFNSSRAMESLKLDQEILISQKTSGVYIVEVIADGLRETKRVVIR